MNRGIQITESDESVFEEHGYTFIHVLGEGTYAKVWLVSYCKINDNKKRDFLLACKVIDNDHSPKDFIKKFIPREIDILSKIKHPHLIHLHSIYQRKMKVFIFMRYAEKGDLLEYVLMNGEIKENKARLWTHQLSLGLQYLHNLDIVHRDIKCENVLITKNNNVKLADFGFSRFIIDSSGRRDLSSTYCGSIAYAAPEVIKGKPYDPKCSDIWSLGVVLYVMVNQCMPFNDTDLKKLYEHQMNSEWCFRSKVGPRLSEPLKVLIHGMLRPDTATRFSINDVVNSSWLLADKRFKMLLEKEKEALQSGLKNKLVMLPKSQKFSILYTKKGKKDEQTICMTSLRFEQSSDQFNLETSSSKDGSIISTEVADSKTKIKSKHDMEEVNKTIITTESPAGASPISKQTKLSSTKLGETEPDDTLKKHSISGIRKQKASLSDVVIKPSKLNLSRTDKYTSVIETEESEKQSTTIRRQTSSAMSKSSNIALNTDKTSLVTPTSSNIALTTDQTSVQEETENEITNPSQPVSETKN